MDPASSSDDDSSSSNGSSANDEDMRRIQARAEAGGLEPVDSSDDNSDYDNEDDDDANYGARPISNFDDLPTDDSEDESDSDDSEDGSIQKKRAIGSSDSSDGGDSDNDDDDVHQEDLPLSERVASRAQAGRRYYTGEENAKDNSTENYHDFDGGKGKRAERKSRAIELASERLREARKDKKKKKQQLSKKGFFAGGSDDDDDDSSVEQTSSNKNNNDNDNNDRKKKKSKHAPTEMSSKRRDYFARGRPDLNSSGIGVSIGANKYKARDPRMVSLSGHLDEDVFRQRYGFLDDVQDKEIERLQKRVGAWKKTGKKGQKERRKLGMTASSTTYEEDHEELKRLLQERAERNRARVVRDAKRSVKQKIREDVASGKRGAYYPKRAELKRMEAEAKFDELRKRGGDEAVEKAIAKRRKKNLGKAAKQMPSHMVK